MGVDVIVPGTGGTNIGRDTGDKLGFYGKAPVARPTGPSASAATADVVANLNTLRTALVNLGLITDGS